MDRFNEELARRLSGLRDQGLLRELRKIESPQGPRLRWAGRDLLNFASNDYLGLAAHPALKEAAHRAIETFGAGAGASRLLAGSLAPHHELEEALADFKRCPAALTFSTGYAAALGTLGTLITSADVVVLDKRVHACIVDAARLSGAQIRVFPHNDLNALERILQWADQRRSTQASAQPARRTHTLVATESVFSMDGDLAPLPELVELKDRYGAWLMVDEAHATGVFGPERRGRVQELGLSNRVEIQMGTLGKALGASGGFIAGSRALIDLLLNKARSFVFSTAPVPATAAAATAALRIVRSDDGRELALRLWENISRTLEDLRRIPAPVPAVFAPILPILLGEETRALAAADRLRNAGVFLPAIRYPTVARGSARLRITLSAAHSRSDLQALAAALETLRDLFPPAHEEPSDRPT
jgi:8-amino-7-oxononanoate synthase